MNSLFCLGMALIPFLCLGLTIALACHADREQALFTAIIKAALVWSGTVWAISNVLSLFDALNGPVISACWLLYLALALWQWRRSRMSFGAGWFIAAFREAPIVCGICALTLVVAVAYPPNQWDVVTYHMPRVMHWLQNHNLSGYPTSIARQVGMPPFNALIALQSFGMGNTDVWLNLTQWLSFVGCILGVMDVTRRLGGEHRAQLLAALFLATLPTAIMAASNTESSNLVAFWLCACTSLYLEWRASSRWQTMLLFGAALGFVVLSKGTGCPIVLPFVLAVAWHCLRSPRKLFCHGLCAACMVLVINVPHFARTFASYGTILASGEVSIVFKPTVGLFATNTLYNFLMNENVLLDGGKADLWQHWVRKYLTDDSDEANFPLGGLERARTNYAPTEAEGQNPLHALSVLLLLCCLPWVRQPVLRRYAALVISSFALFNLLLIWMPVTVRYQIPLFALVAPLFALACGRIPWRRWGGLVTLLLVAEAFMPLFFCLERPLGPAGPLQPYREGIAHFLTHPREQLMFNNRMWIYPAYERAVSRLASEGVREVGIQVGENGWEYPLWAMLRSRMRHMPHMVHMVADRQGDMPRPEYVFVHENKVFQPLVEPHLLRWQDGAYREMRP